MVWGTNLNVREKYKVIAGDIPLGKLQTLGTPTISDQKSAWNQLENTGSACSYISVLLITSRNRERRDANEILQQDMRLKIPAGCIGEHCRLSLHSLCQFSTATAFKILGPEHIEVMTLTLQGHDTGHVTSSVTRSRDHSIPQKLMSFPYLLTLVVLWNQASIIKRFPKYLMLWRNDCH